MPWNSLHWTYPYNQRQENSYPVQTNYFFLRKKKEERGERTMKI
jgi:hypothetical protein